MKISNYSACTINFKKNHEEDNIDPSTYARQIIRQRLEEKLGGEYLYPEQIKRLSAEQIISQFNKIASANPFAKAQTNKTTTSTVDYQYPSTSHQPSESYAKSP